LFSRQGMLLRFQKNCSYWLVRMSFA
jgi:hypothetical protein